jgi:nucleoside-diphosphate-sugar epimerase
VRVLVTGAHGFIGSHLSRGLLGRGHTVRALVTPWGDTRLIADLEGHANFELIRADITQMVSLTGITEGIDVVFHVAARVADWGAWEAFHRTNVQGTEHLVAQSEREGVKRFVFVSSIAVHPYTGYRNADTRTLPTTSTINAYARSKRLADERVMTAKRLEPVIVRPGTWPFGPGNPEVARAAEALRKGILPLVDGGCSVISTAYIENLIEGLILAGTVPQAAGRTYLIADEGMPSWREIFETLAELLHVRPPRWSVPGRLLEPLGTTLEQLYARVAPRRAPPLTRYGGRLMRQDLHFSIEAARQELGYEPRVSWQEGLRRTVQVLEEAP